MGIRINRDFTYPVYNEDMTFGDLAQYLERLEGISSRLEMTKVLAGLFKEIGPEDARLVAYISQGKLGPAYSAPDFGVADKMMLKALGEKAVEVFREVGDLGKTAEKIATNNKISSLNIQEVFGKLHEIAQVSGTGSQEKKQQLIRNLILELDPVGAKYAVKIILGKLRTGFSDMTVLDSLSWMIVGDKSLRERIEDIYNVRADLGEVAFLVKTQNLNSLKIDPKVGTPVLVARAERAKDAKDLWDRLGVSAAEHKLDGLRIQGHLPTGRQALLFSRGMDNVTAMYPDVAEGLKKQINKECIVDGEMIAVGEDGKYLPFQETMQRKRKYDILEMIKSVPLKIFLFDILSLEGENLLDKPNEERRKILESVVEKGEIVKLMPRKIVKSVEEIEKFFIEALAQGTEGMMAKNLHSGYQSGSRNFNWIKYKKSYDKSEMADTVDAVVMGYDVGQGKRSGFGIGDFLIGIYDPEKDKYLTIAKIGTGLKDDEWRRMKREVDEIAVFGKPENYVVAKTMGVDVWAKPKIVVEILADEITKSPAHTSGLALRFPRLVSWREKKPEDATAATEIERLYKLQRK